MTSAIRVLLVEDNPGDADLTRETLEDGKLFVQIDVVVDGAQALDFLLRRSPFTDALQPDLILLDLNLPKMGGREVLAEIKKHPSLRVIPVVVLTSSDAEQDVVKSYELGASCYVTKPVGLQAFQSIVHAIEKFWFTVVRLP
jgi:CheY-like chemotaxis protein